MGEKSLPSFLRVPFQKIWDGQKPRRETECLHLIRLLYLQSAFLIDWAAWRHGIEESSLLRSALGLLSWVNDAFKRREELPSQGFISLAWRVCITANSLCNLVRLTLYLASCALPAAGVLELYLLQPKLPQSIQGTRRSSATTSHGKLFGSHRPYGYRA